jgi:hypothetical protein
MENKKITNLSELQTRINELEKEEIKYRTLINVQLSQAFDAVKSPASVLKKTVKELADDKEFRNDLILAGINIAGRFLKKKFSGSFTTSGLISMILDKFKNAKT